MIRDLTNFATMLLTLSALTALIFAAIASPRELGLPRRGAKIGLPILSIAGAAILFSVGFSIMAMLNVVVARLRFDGGYDALLNHVDSWILAGYTVPRFVDYAVSHFSRAWFSIAEGIYAALFPMIGAMILLLGSKRGWREPFRFVCMILTAYAISLAVFFFIPAGGPFMLSSNLSDTFPTLGVTFYQRFVVAQFAGLLAHRSVASASYLIACPSMHMAQATVLAWAARPWRRLGIILTAYAVILAPAILLLEEHYVVDLIVGIAVAGLAITIWQNKERP